MSESHGGTEQIDTSGRDHFSEKQREEVKKMLDASSSKNRNQAIFFFSFGIYILVSTLGTTDVMLFLPQNSFKLPFINVELDLVSFYVLGPILLFVFHLNQLLYYNTYLYKLQMYKKVYPEAGAASRDSVDYDFIYRLGTDTFEGKVLNIFVWVLLYLLPLYVLFTIYMRFADYHDLVISSMHIGIFIVDIIMIMVSVAYNTKVMRDFSGTLNPKHKSEAGTEAQEFVSIFVRGKEMFHFSLRLFDVIRKDASLILLGVFGIIGIVHFWLYFYPMVVEPYDQRSCLTNRSDDSCVAKTVCSYINHLPGMQQDCIPRLVVREKDMVNISQNTLYLPKALNRDQQNGSDLTDEDLILKFGARTDLYKRNLRHANLEGIILTRVDLQGAQLQDARLRNAQLQGALLTGANLEDADLIKVHLQRAKLQNAHLERTVLTLAQIQGADLGSAKLNDSTLNSAILDNANLFDARLEGSDLNHTSFIAASMNQARLSGARLSYTDLRYASMAKADLTDVDLTESNLTGANLYDSNLTGSNLNKSDMTSVNLFNTVLVGVDLTGADLTGATLTGANLFGANLLKTDLTAARIINVDLSGANLEDAIFDFVELNGTDLSGANLFGANLCKTSIYDDVKLVGSYMREYDLSDHSENLVTFYKSHSMCDTYNSMLDILKDQKSWSSDDITKAVKCDESFEHNTSLVIDRLSSVKDNRPDDVNNHLYRTRQNLSIQNIKKFKQKKVLDVNRTGKEKFDMKMIIARLEGLHDVACHKENNKKDR